MFPPIAIISLCILQSPQAQYVAYVAQFEGVQAVSGTLLGRGGPVSQPTGSIFRAAPGGRYQLIGATFEQYSDGSVGYSYSPAANTYMVGEPNSVTFRLFFGPRFGTSARKRDEILSVKEVDYEGEKATVFAILPWGQSTEVELFVRTRDKRPIAIRAQGQQSSYATTVVQLETKLSFRKEFWTWTPPEGAKKR